MRTEYREPELKRGALIMSPLAKVDYSVYIDLTGDVFIDDDAEVAENVTIITHRHLWNHSRERRADIQTKEAVDLRIGKDAFIGMGAYLVCVSEIGDGAIVGAGSVVTKNVPPYEVWAGNPAKKINERISA